MSFTCCGDEKLFLLLAANNGDDASTPRVVDA